MRYLILILIITSCSKVTTEKINYHIIHTGGVVSIVMNNDTTLLTNTFDTTFIVVNHEGYDNKYYYRVIVITKDGEQSIINGSISIDDNIVLERTVNQRDCFVGSYIFTYSN